MGVRVAINGFGRTGRAFLRAAVKSPHDVEVAAVNDLGSPEALARLLSRDSVHGRFPLPSLRRAWGDDGGVVLGGDGDGTES